MTSPINLYGVTVTAQQVKSAEERGLARNVVRDRLKRGWSVEDAITKPKVMDRSARARRGAKKSPWRHGFAKWHPR